MRGFQNNYFWNNNCFIRRELNCKRFYFHTHAFGHCTFFSGEKVTAPPPPKSEGPPTPMRGNKIEV